MFAVQMVKSSGKNVWFWAEEHLKAGWEQGNIFNAIFLTVLTGKDNIFSQISFCCMYNLMGDLLVVKVWKDMP